MSLGRSGPSVRSGFLETPRTRFGGVFLASAQTASQFAVSRHAWVASGTAQRLWMSITGSSSNRRLEECRVVVGLHDLAPVGRWAPGGCERRRLERFAQMREDLPDRPWFRDERDQPDVTPAVRALKRKLLPHPGQGKPAGLRSRPRSRDPRFPPRRGIDARHRRRPAASLIANPQKPLAAASGMTRSITTRAFAQPRRS
jgi:hypothetical protein